MTGNLDRKVVVITGGSRGLGQAMAQEMARAGAKVMISARSASAIQKAVESISAQGFTAAGTTCDVTRLEEVNRLLSETLEKFGQVDIWVNNAGISSPYGPTLQVPVSDFLDVQNTNINGVYFGSRVAMRYFIPRGRGKLINILGRGWQGPVPYQNAYAASKIWIKNFTLALAKETRASGVGVFAFNPGMVYTDLLTNIRVLEGSESRLKSFPMVIRILAKTVREPARKAAWIASPATDGKTGKVYTVPSLVPAVGNALQVLLARIAHTDPHLPEVYSESISGDPVPESVIQATPQPDLRN